MGIVNIILAEDMQLIREGISSLLKHEDGVNVIAHAKDGEDVLQLVEKHKHEVDVVVMDLEMPHKTGLEASAEIMAKYTTRKIGIVILTTHKEKVYLRQALKLGIPGYILKDDAYDELLHAIREVASGEEYYGKELLKIQREIIREGEQPKPKVSKREIEIIKALAKGLTNEEIGEELHIASNTVHTHLRNIRKKLDARNGRELLMKAVQVGLIDPNISLGGD